MLKFNENRTFGIEIEVLRTPRITTNRIALAINRKGVDAVAESYNHTTRPHWKVTVDASCGLEIVSPILKGYEGLRQLKLVCEALNEIGAKIDKKCGVHVHHDVNDYQVKNFKNLFKMYIKYEKNIDAIMPTSRRGNNNQYCKSMLGYGDTLEGLLERVDRMNTAQEIANMRGTRYVKLNIHSYFRYGTIEFRQHAGSTDYEKIANWVMLTQAMVEKAKVATTTNKLSANANGVNGIDGLICCLRINRKDAVNEELRAVASYYKKREKALNRDMAALAA